MAARIVSAYFSPTRTTARIVDAVVGEMAGACGLAARTVDFTLPAQRPVHEGRLSSEDVLVLGFPVYAGRVPKLVEEELARLTGDGARAVAIGLYGNRAYDDALLEAADLLEARGFAVVAAGAFVGEHSMTARVASGRPDEDDLEAARRFGRSAAARIASGATDRPAVPGARPYKSRPAPADIRPQTTDDCTSCGACATVCPLGIVDADDPARVGEGCLRCNACVKSCPERAKFFDSEPTNAIVAMLESSCIERKEPELFL